MAGHPGCTNQTPPKQNITTEIPNSLYFSGRSFIYRGGVGFITPAPGPRPTKVRAYLITLEQFWQIVGQENDWHKMKTYSPDEIREKGNVVLDDIGGQYSQ